MEHDARNQLYQIAMPQIAGKSGRVHLRYDRQGDLIEMTRPRGDYNDATLAGAPIANRIIRDVQGHITRTTFAANTATSRSQSQITDYHGFVICATDPVGTVTQQCFDERGLQLRQVETGTDGTTRQNQWVYDRSDRLEINRSGIGAATETRYVYDAFGRLAKITLPTGAEQIYTYGPGDTIVDEQLVGDDGAGTIRLLARKSYTYDERGRPVTETRFAFEDDPAAAQLLTVKNTFDADDRLVATEDHRGAVTRMGYDGLGRLVSLTDAAGNVTVHSYDAAGRRIATQHLDQE